jgi:hypothetical protein
VTVTYGGAFTTGTLSVKATNGCGVSTARTLAIGSVPSQPSTVTGQTSAVCAGSVKPYAVTAVAGVTYQWSSSTTNASITAGQGTNAVTVTFNGSFASGVLTVTPSNACGTGTARTLSMAALPSQPSTVTGVASNLCAASPSTYSVTAVSGVTYAWSTSVAGAVLSPNANAVTVTWPASFSSGTLSVTPTNACGTGPVRTLAVTGYPAQPSTITGPSTAVCAGSVKSYAVTNTAGLMYNWSFSTTAAAITAGQGTNAVTVAYGSGFTTGTLSVTASNGCGVSTARTLAVSSKPAQPSAVTGPVSGNCSSTGAYGVTAVSGVTYSWSTSVSGSSLVPSAAPGNAVTVTWAPFFTGTLSVTPSNACGAGPVRVLAVYAYPATVTAVTGAATACANTDNVYTATAMAGATSYLWALPTGATFVGASNAQTVTVHFGTSSGNVTAKAVNACGTGLPKSKAVTVTACRVDENQNGTWGIMLYPNPSTGTVYFEFAESGLLNVYDLSGKTIRSEAVGRPELTLSDLPGGVLFFRFTNENGRVRTGSFVVVKD